ncbi:MAG TPA: ABC transporter permease [Candidatus Paceibacterota bacterium]|nr:ABC transporter permease [Verrucomicrobiota bacterium]HOX01014.1 ABC transporter permease [Verrucomicrobiota bacterium]HRZ43882.1 ABC transporter permease [Candidatus Paceibacterota bacterium]
MRLAQDLTEGLRVSWGALRANRLRSGLTMLGVIIGVITVTLMGAAIVGLNRAFLSSISSLGTDVLYVQKFPWFERLDWSQVRNRRDLTLRDARSIARLSTLARAVAPQAITLRPVAYGSRSATGVQICGGGADTALVGGLSITSGRFLSPYEIDGARPVCVIGAALAEKFFPRESPLGHRLRIAGQQYEIVGVLDRIGEFLGIVNFDNRVIVPVTRYFTDIERWPNIDILVKVADMSQMDETIEELRGIVRRLRRIPPGQPDDFAINRQELFLKSFRKLSAMIATAGFCITGLSLFVGGIGIMNVMFVSVAERTREIGIRKAVGARRRTILTQFLIEAALISLAGGAVAIGLALPIVLVMRQWFPASISPPVAALALGISALTGILSGLLPAWRAGSQNTVDALRHE